jgi:hypothetical protein
VPSPSVTTLRLSPTDLYLFRSVALTVPKSITLH